MTLLFRSSSVPVKFLRKASIQDLQRRAGRELAQAVDPLGVVDEVLAGQVVVEGAEVLGGDLEVLEHALADRHARHHDDELEEAVAARQLVDRAQVDVGLAGAGLHLDREVRAAAGDVRGPVEELPGFRRRAGVRDLDVVALLDGAQVLAQPLLREEKLVAHPQLAALLPGEQAAPFAHVDHGVFGRALRLALEQVDHRIDGSALEGLVGVELDLQDGLRSPPGRSIERMSSTSLCSHSA